MAQRPHAQAVPSSPLVDATTGEVDSAWRAFLVGLYNRSGGANGVVAASAADLAAETAARIAADAAMAASIAALAHGQGAAGADFTAQLAAEQAQRRAADVALQAYIDNKPGVTNGSDAAAGVVGEFLQATSGAVALTSGVNAVTASLNLTPGDWQVDGNALFTPSAAANATQLQVASGTSATVLYYATNISATFATGAGTLLSIGYPTRFSFSAATTVYVVAGATFTGGTMTAQGTISARRVR